MLMLVLMIVFLIAPPAGRAQSGVALTGEIRDRFGAVVSDSTVSLYSPDRVLQTTSDSQGRIEFENVTLGTYELEASHPGFKSGTIAAVQITGQDLKPISIILDIDELGCASVDTVGYERTHTGGGGTLKGRVLMDSKLPVPEAKIQILNVSGTKFLASQRSNQRGEFLFAELEPGRYILSVSHAGYHDERRQRLWITRENQTTVSVVMLRPGLIRVCE
jgi:hypothetical protein